MKKNWVVIFRTGGTLNFRWNMVGSFYCDKKEAQAKAKELNRMGYPALVHDFKLLNSIGFPETFSAAQEVCRTDFNYKHFCS